MTIGEIVLAIWEQIYGFIPFRTIPVWEQGVHVRLGNVTKLLTSRNGIFGSGLHFFMPLFSEIHTMDSSIAVLHTAAQTHTTADGHVVTYSWVLRFRVSDLKRLYETIYQPDQSIVAEVVASAGQLIGEFNLDEISGFEDEDGVSHESFEQWVERDVRGRFEEWGLELESLTLASFARCKALRIIGS